MRNLSSHNIEILCKKCGSPEIEVFWDDVRIEMSVCVCLNCSNSGILTEFEYEV